MGSDRYIAARLPAWGDCHVLGNLGGGHRNEVLLIEKEGEKYVAKSSRRSAEAIAWLEPVQAMAREAGFIVPHFLRSRAGELLVDGIAIEDWIEGAHPSPGDLAPLGYLLEKFHSSTASWPQRPGFASTLELVHLERGGDVDLTAMPSHLVDVCRAAWRYLANEPVSAVHGDPNPTNLLLTAEGQLALIDWDEARTDLSALDMAADVDAAPTPRGDAVLQALLAWEVAASWLLEPEYARRLARDLYQWSSARNG